MEFRSNLLEEDDSDQHDFVVRGGDDSHIFCLLHSWLLDAHDNDQHEGRTARRVGGVRLRWGHLVGQLAWVIVTLMSEDMLLNVLLHDSTDVFNQVVARILTMQQDWPAVRGLLAETISRGIGNYRLLIHYIISYIHHYSP